MGKKIHLTPSFLSFCFKINSFLKLMWLYKCHSYALVGSNNFHCSWTQHSIWIICKHQFRVFTGGRKFGCYYYHFCTQMKSCHKVIWVVSVFSHLFVFACYQKGQWSSVSVANSQTEKTQKSLHPWEFFLVITKTHQGTVLRSNHQDRIFLQHSATE